MPRGARAADAAADGFAPVPELLPLNSGNLPFYWVAAVDVQSPSTTGAVVLFGDSITDGRCSTRDGNGVVQPDLYQRWGDVLAERAGATHVIFFEGTNDITGGFTAAQVMAGTQQIIDQVHAKGLKIIGVTVIPRGRPAPLTGWTTSTEQ